MFLRYDYILPCLAMALALLTSCGDTDEAIVPVSRPVELVELDCMEPDGIDSSTHTIKCSRPKNGVETVKVKTFEFSGDYSAYLVVGDDLEDPELDWDMPIKKGTKIPVPDTGSVAFAILDEKDCVVEVWTVVFTPVEASSSSKKSSSSSAKSKSSSSVKKESSSSAKPESSSSAKKESSSSAKPESSSSAKKESSSSAKPESSSSSKPASSSSAMPESSSSEKSSSSSATPETSSSEESSCSSSLESSSSSETVPAESSSSSEPVLGVLLRDFNVDGGTVSVNGNKVYVEVPYGTNLKMLRVQPMDTLANLERPVEMKFLDDLGVLGTYTVVAGTQLPGTHFDARDNTGFWATTSDAMANSIKEAAIRIESDANLEFESSQMTISTKILAGSFLLIEGFWKLAGGFYFAGEYSGNSAIDIYEQGYTEGTPDTGPSDISKDMTFGKPFTARPTAFDVTYSYSHTKGKNSTYPQKGLIYVMLVSADDKVVASGVVTDDSSVDMHQVRVNLVYGSDSGILDAGYPVKEGLSVGTGNEDVASIHVMFASSAYAFVVAGAALGIESNYRGGKNSKLVVDEFKLVY